MLQNFNLGDVFMELKAAIHSYYLGGFWVQVLITGCAGFIGSHLCERFLGAGYTVTGVDALTEYYDPQSKIRNMERCLDYNRFHFCRGSLTDLDKDLIEDAELVFHLAAQPGVRPSWGKDFQTYLMRNVLDTQLLLERLRHSGNLRKLIYASSSSVYGITEVERVREDHPKAPFSPYGVTKLAAEQLCSAYSANFGTPVVSLRLFTVFGPRQRPDMMFSKLISAALTGGRFVRYGDGTMQRDFTSVSDVVAGFTLAASAPIVNGVFNIAGGQVVSINDAIAIVEDIVGVRIRIETREERSGDVRRTGADISAAHNQLGYTPLHNLRGTLEAQIAFSESLLVAKGPAAVA
jgi:nucleoside-diphosphate-sugar epimerase